MSGRRELLYEALRPTRRQSIAERETVGWSEDKREDANAAVAAAVLTPPRLIIHLNLSKLCVVKRRLVFRTQCIYSVVHSIQ